jgi:hypothetical protein
MSHWGRASVGFLHVPGKQSLPALLLRSRKRSGLEPSVLSNAFLGCRLPKLDSETGRSDLA